MSVRTGIVGAACSALLMLTAASTASATWLAPADLTTAGQSSAQAQVVVDSRGDATAVWTHAGGSSYAIQAATRPAGGSWQSPVDLSSPGQLVDLPRIGVDSRGDVTAVWIRYNGANNVAEAATRPAGSGWQAPVALSNPGQDAAVAQIAVDPQGDATAVWDRSNGTNTIVQAANRPAGGAWQSPVDLSDPGQDAYGPEVAVDLQGNTTAVWQRSNGTNYIIQAATRPAGGAWQSSVSLSNAGHGANRPMVAVDPQGNTTAVWDRFNGTNYIIQAATRPAGGAWQSSVDLSSPGHNAETAQVAVDPAGNATAVWDRSNGTNTIVQAANRPAGGAWQSPVDLSDPGQDAYGPEVAVDLQGNTTAVWQRSNGTNYIIQAATRPAGGAWQSSVDLSSPGHNAETAQVAVDPAGNATAVWDRSNGTNYIIQAATRPAGGAWQSSVDLSNPGEDAVLPQIAADPQGDTTAVWDCFNGANTIVQAAARPAGGTWQAPVDLSNPGQNAETAQVAVDPAGNATAVWDRSNGTNTIVQAAGDDVSGPLLDGLSIPATAVAGTPLSLSVSPLDVWSPLAATSWSFGDGQAATGTTVTHTYAAAGRYPVTLTSADSLGHTSAATAQITVSAAPTVGTGPAPTSPAPTTPALGRVSQSHATWRTGRALARIAHATRARRAPVGTTFTFTLDEAASVTLTFDKPRSGRRVHRRCVAPTRKNRGAHRCTRSVKDSSLTLAAHAGLNKLGFQGRTSRRHTLKPGRYTLTLTATASGKRSRTRTLRFTIVR